jgi:hypothetical protein
MSIGILAADIATEAMRLGLCSSLPSVDQPSICRQSAATVAALSAKMKVLMDLWFEQGQHPVDPPPPLSQEGSQMEQPVRAPEF